MTHDPDLIARVAEAVIESLWSSCAACGGSGMVLDPDESARQGEPTPMQCDRCAYLHCGLNPIAHDQERVMDEIARAVLDALDLPARDRRAKAEALREAADVVAPWGPARWLRARADELDAEGADDE